MESVTRVQIVDKAVSLGINTLEKIWIQLFSSQLWVNNKVDLEISMSTGIREENKKIEFKLVLVCLKNDLVINPARSGGTG